MSAENEISLIELLTQAYLFWLRRKKIIIICWVVFAAYSLILFWSSAIKQKHFRAELEVSAPLLSKEILRNTVFKLFTPGKKINQDKLVLLNTSSKVLKNISSIENPSKNIDSDSSSVFLFITFNNKDSLNTIADGVISIIKSDNDIKEQVNAVSNFKEQYLKKLNDKINEIETFNGLLLKNLNEKSVNSFNMSNYSNKELFILIQERQRIEQSISQSPITFRTVDINEVIPAVLLLKQTLVYSVLGIFLGVFIAFFIDLAKQIKTEAKKE